MEHCQAQVNMTELNKYFMKSCVESLKRDNSTCLAPAICEYLIQTMNIINHIQSNSNTGLPRMKGLLHDIRKLVSRVNGKYFEVKAKQETIKERKSGKTTSTPAKPRIESSLPIPAANNRKREREITPQSTSPRIFSTFNGDSRARDQALSNKRVREEETTPPSSPALPTCNGLIPQKGINLFSLPTQSPPALSFQRTPTPNSTPNSTPTKVAPNETSNLTPLSSKTNSPAQFNTGVRLFQLQSKEDLNSIKASPQENAKPKPFSELSQWPGLTPVTKPQESPFQNKFQWGNPGTDNGSPPVFTSFPSMNVKIDPKGIASQSGMMGGWAGIKPPTTETSAPPLKNGDEDEDEEPPKHEFTPVVEDNAVYSKRCKLFEKREGSFKERGIGVLYINELKTGKYQIVIRADNTLGTVLMNTHLNSAVPVQKSGKNNVLTVDPTGDGGKAISVLIRVKTGEDADELIEKLNEFKGKSS